MKLKIKSKLNNKNAQKTKFGKNVEMLVNLPVRVCIVKNLVALFVKCRGVLVPIILFGYRLEVLVLNGQNAQVG